MWKQKSAWLCYLRPYTSKQFCWNSSKDKQLFRENRGSYLQVFLRSNSINIRLLQNVDQNFGRNSFFIEILPNWKQLNNVHYNISNRTIHLFMYANNYRKSTWTGDTCLYFSQMNLTERCLISLLVKMTEMFPNSCEFTKSPTKVSLLLKILPPCLSYTVSYKRWV